MVSPVVLLGESTCRAASTAPFPAACSNALLEILNGIDAHTVEVDDVVFATVNMVYFECRFVLLSSLYIYFQNGTSMVNEGFWIGLEVANTPANHLRSAARAVDYLHRAFDVIPKVDATKCLVRVQPHASGGSALQLA